MPPNSNKTVVITGAANGLGRALAKAFYNRGFHLALLDIDRAGLGSFQRECLNTRQILSIHQVDVAEEEAVIAARQEILQCHKSIDVLINNAGISISLPFEHTAIEDFRRLFEVNFWGMIHCTRHFLPDLRKGTAASIANIISGFALIGFPGKTAYAASKSAIMGFTSALKAELADPNVRISLVIPPPLATNIVMAGKHINQDKRMAETAFLSAHGMPLQEAADKIVSRILRGKYRIVIGAKTALMDLVARLFPTAVHRLIAGNKDSFDFV